MKYIFFKTNHDDPRRYKEYEEIKADLICGKQFKLISLQSIKIMYNQKKN